MVPIGINSKELWHCCSEEQGFGKGNMESKEKVPRKFAPNLILTRSEAPLGYTFKWKHK